MIHTGKINKITRRNQVKDYHKELVEIKDITRKLKDESKI